MYEGDEAFLEWIRQLDEDVIQGEYGYEPGEFTVYPSHWRELYSKGCSPSEAFKRALDALGEARREEDEARKANWARIVAEDEAAIARYRAATNPSPPLR